MLLLLTLLLPSAGWSAESPAVQSARPTVTLVSDTDATAPGTPYRVGLRLRLAPGWHTYWKNPGDAGIPPELEFSLAPGVTAGRSPGPRRRGSPKTR